MVVSPKGTRVLYLKRRRVSADGTWMDDDNYNVTEVPLTAGSIFFLHPDDEQPKKRAGQKYRSQYQHGNVHVQQGLSLSLVFRVVTSKAKVCVADNRKVLLDKDVQRLGKKLKFQTGMLKTVATHHDEALERFRAAAKLLEPKFRKYAIDKMAEWGWPIND